MAAAAAVLMVVMARGAHGGVDDGGQGATHIHENGRALVRATSEGHARRHDLQVGEILPSTLPHLRNSCFSNERLIQAV